MVELLKVEINVNQDVVVELYKVEIDINQACSGGTIEGGDRY